MNINRQQELKEILINQVKEETVGNNILTLQNEKEGQVFIDQTIRLIDLWSQLDSIDKVELKKNKNKI